MTYYSMKSFQFLVKCNIAERMNALNFEWRQKDIKNLVESLSSVATTELESHFDIIYSKLASFEEIPQRRKAFLRKKKELALETVFMQEMLSMEVGDEPTTGNIARVQIRMPDGKRMVRKFDGDSPVKDIYAFVAQSNEEAKDGRAFKLTAKFPPQELFASIEDSISGCGLNGEAINVLWK